MKEKSFFDIIEEFYLEKGQNRFSTFCETLKTKLKENCITEVERKYPDIPVEEGLRLFFIEKYFELLCSVDLTHKKLFDDNENLKTKESKHNLKIYERKLKDRARNNINPCFCLCNANKSETNNKSISRKIIIEFAFAISMNKYIDGEKIANDLLMSMGYPKLHLSSTIEIFYAYSLRNNLSYSKCCSMIEKYQAFPKSDFDSTKIDTDNSSTYFGKEIVAAESEEKFFLKMNIFHQMLDKGSKKITKNFIETFKIANKKYSTLNLEYGLEAKLAFYLFYYTCYKGDFLQFLQMFMENLLYSNQTNEQSSEKIDITTELIENYFRCNNIVDFSENTDNDKWKYSYNSQHYFFPIKGHSRKYDINSFEKKSSCNFDTISYDIDNLLGRQTKYNKGQRCNVDYPILSREAYILWLVFLGFDLEDINALIGCRYARLDENVYFDNFIITVLSFKLENEQVKFKNISVTDTETLSKKDICNLRQSIIYELSLFDIDCSCESFVTISKSTS